MKNAYLIAVLFLFAFLSACSSKVPMSEKAVSTRADSLRAADAAFKELDEETSGKKRMVDSVTKKETPEKTLQDDSLSRKNSMPEEKASPAARAENKRRPTATGTIYPVVNGYPVWVTNPNVQGYSYTAVGSAVPCAGGLPEQKRVARIHAMGEISRMIKVQVDNEVSSSTFSSGGSVRSEFSTYSRQRSDNILNSVSEIDSWIDPKNGDFYLFLGIKGE